MKERSEAGEQMPVSEATTFWDVAFKAFNRNERAQLVMAEDGLFEQVRCSLIT